MHPTREQIVCQGNIRRAYSPTFTGRNGHSFDLSYVASISTLCNKFRLWMPFIQILPQERLALRADQKRDHVAGFDDGAATREDEFTVAADRDDQRVLRKVSVAQGFSGQRHTGFDPRFDNTRSFDQPAHESAIFR